MGKVTLLIFKFYVCVTTGQLKIIGIIIFLLFSHTFIEFSHYLWLTLYFSSQFIPVRNVFMEALMV